MFGRSSWFEVVFVGLIAWRVLVLMSWYSIECCGSVVLGELG